MTSINKANDVTDDQVKVSAPNKAVSGAHTLMVPGDQVKEAWKDGSID
jgi:hypothetical protein